MRKSLGMQILIFAAMLGAMPPAFAQARPHLTTNDYDAIAKRLDLARRSIQPSLGATTYEFSRQAIDNVPQGENAPLNQVLRRAPGVAFGSGRAR